MKGVLFFLVNSISMCSIVMSLVLVFSVKALATSVDTVKLYQNIEPSLCIVLALDASKRRLGMGSGFVLNAQGHVVTNAHVLGQAHSVVVECNGEKASVIGIATSADSQDVVILDTTLRAPNPIKSLGKSRPKTGTLVFVLGNPHGLSSTITPGIVSGYREFEGHPFVQLSAAINPGNSGGPVVDQQGRVIGIATLKLLNAEGIGFAVPSSAIRAVEWHSVDKVLGDSSANHNITSDQSMVANDIKFRDIAFGTRCKELQLNDYLLAHVSIDENSNQLLSGVSQSLMGIETDVYYRCKNGVFVEGIYGLMPNQLDSVLAALTTKYGKGTQQKRSLVSRDYRWQPTRGYEIKLSVSRNNFVLKYTHLNMIKLIERTQQMAAIASGEL